LPEDIAALRSPGRSTIGGAGSMNVSRVRSACLVLGLALLQGCAFDLVQVKQMPTSLETTVEPRADLRIDKEASFRAGGGYSRTLRQGPRWSFVGTTPNGDVYRTKDQILTVEAANVHEAYIVLQGTRLRGFYLPVEKTFSPLDPPLELAT